MNETPYEIRARWKTRRRMAKVSFAYLLLVVPVMAFFVDSEKIGLLAGVTIAVIGALATLISVYIGSAAYEDTNRNG